MAEIGQMCTRPGPWSHLRIFQLPEVVRSKNTEFSYKELLLGNKMQPTTRGAAGGNSRNRVLVLQVGGCAVG